MKKFKIIIFSCLVISLFNSCSETPNGNNGTATSIPKITSLSTDKEQIMYGGLEHATLTCEATGGNLTYTWEVDLGDIIPVKSDKSIVTFAGVACCVGEKVIKCTVSNSLGFDTKEIKVFILDQISPPEIINIETNKKQLSVSANETANIVCYGIGGSLVYLWYSECGEIKVDPLDKTKCSYIPSNSCKGTRYIKCTISNPAGSYIDSVAINVVD